MSAKSVRDKRRDSACSSPPLAPAIGKSFSSTCLDPKASRLDKILSKGVNVNQQCTALQCFNLAAKYRNNPRYHPQNILKNMRGASLPSSPRPDEFGVPLTRAHSMPGLDLRALSPPSPSPLSAPPPRAVSAPPCANALEEDEPPDPRCQRCIDGDPELERNPRDSSWACIQCGTVAQLNEMKGQKRSKNCEEAKDPTMVSDGPPVRTAQEAEYLSWSKGPESDADKRRREAAHAGGTRMSTDKLRKNKLIDAQNVLDKEAKRNVEEMLRKDGGPDQGRRKRIVLALEAVFDQLPLLIDAVRDHIRREAIRIYSNSMKHEEACGRKSCMLALSHWTNPVIAYGITEYVLEYLSSPTRDPEGAGEPGSPVTTIASLAPEWSKKEVQTQLRVLNELQVKNSNQVLRNQVASAIAIVAEWETREHMCVPCADDSSGANANAPSAEQPARAEGALGPLESAHRDRLRDRILATASRTHAVSNVRDVALAQLAVPTTMTFLAESGLPDDVAAMGLLASSAIKQQLGDPTTALRKCYLPNLNVSETTFGALVGELVGLIKIPRRGLAKVHDDIF